MWIKKFKPTTPWRRWMTGLTFEELTTSTPYKPLVIKLKKHAWRNSSWRITVRHQWGGHAKAYRIVDFYLTDKKDIPARVETIEYDPYRSAFIALVCYADWERRYVIAHKTMKVGDTIITSDNAKPIEGNRLLIGEIPTWFTVYNVEAIVWQGATMVRSAGSFATIVTQEGEYTQIKLASGELRKVHKKCYANVWAVSNEDHGQVVIGKAWRSRWKWIRPTVLGKSMNPVDHPHWGWEWHSPIGMKAPKTPWWKLALGVKTRKRKNSTNKWIIKTRKGLKLK